MKLNHITIAFDEQYSRKIRMIETAISDPTTSRKIVEGLVDVGFANALKNLFKDGSISQKVFTQGFNQLPEHLRSCFYS